MKQIPAVLMAALVGVGAYGDTHPCPPYQVWGGQKCEWVAYCPDGKPWQGEACTKEPSTSQQLSPAPRPVPQPVPAPVRPPVPVPFPPTPQPPAPSCTGGQFLRDGRCVCPDGYRWASGSCKPISRDCEVRSVFGPAKGRKVLLVNGRALDLFHRYVGDLELQNAEPNYETLRLYIYGTEGRREELRATLTMGDLFLGITYKDKWRRLLRNRVAADRPLPQEDAKLLDSDVICGQR